MASLSVDESPNLNPTAHLGSWPGASPQSPRGGAGGKQPPWSVWVVTGPDWHTQAGLDLSRSNFGSPASNRQNAYSSHRILRPSPDIKPRATLRASMSPGGDRLCPTGGRTPLSSTGHGQALCWTRHESHLIPSPQSSGEAEKRNDVPKVTQTSKRRMCLALGHQGNNTKNLRRASGFRTREVTQSLPSQGLETQLGRAHPAPGTLPSPGPSVIPRSTPPTHPPKPGDVTCGAVNHTPE